ncbi:MAG: hypothetical protein M3Q08_13915 [Pseudomonadota bacterium]|nr:hypothetical protein [Pseudomonadota bacterium]
MHRLGPGLIKVTALLLARELIPAAAKVVAGPVRQSRPGDLGDRIEDSFKLLPPCFERFLLLLTIVDVRRNATTPWAVGAACTSYQAFIVGKKPSALLGWRVTMTLLKRFQNIDPASSGKAARTCSPINGDLKQSRVAHAC